MMARILVPLDGSEVAERCLSCVTFMRGMPEVAVDLLRVREADHEPTSNEEIERYLRVQASELSRSMGVEVNHRVGHGIPYIAILEEAESQDVMMVAMTTHGRTGMARHGVGSVTDKVSRLARCPTLVINRSCPPDNESVDLFIVPMDGSELAEEALSAAGLLAEKLDKPLMLLRIVETEAMSATPMEDSVLDKMGVDAGAYLSDIRHRLPDSLQVEQVVRRGPVVESLLHEVEQRENALLVMSSHGGDGYRSYAVGNVTDELLLEIPVPVLLVGPGQAERMAFALGEQSAD